LIKLQNITKHYSESSEPALRGIDLHIGKGEFVALMGESGSGKTSLLNILGLIDQPSSGEYFFGDQNVAGLNEKERTLFRRKKLGFIFQFFNLLPALSVKENIALPLHLNGIRNYEKVVKERLSQVGIPELEGRSLNTLSGGQMQRVAIARALIHEPSFILADEPTGNLDSKTAEDILSLLVKIRKENNLTIIMVTHSHESANHADRKVEIIDGKIKE
jgi:putative ABC transport system ATP-binding protein